MKVKTILLKSKFWQWDYICKKICSEGRNHLLKSKNLRMGQFYWNLVLSVKAAGDIKMPTMHNILKHVDADSAIDDVDSILISN